MLAVLKPHPATPSSPITRINVEVWRQDASLSLIYSFEGDADRIRWPDLGQQERTDGLWRTTCLEAFLSPGEGEGYAELNFSPSGRWAAYQFDGPRVGMRDLEEIEVRPWVEPDPATRRYSTVVRLERTSLAGQPWRLGLSAVIEDADGAISYWALAHPSDKPDFHHPDSFVLELP